MKLFVPYRRATLLVPSGPAHDPDQKHLFIVLNDPARVCHGLAISRFTTPKISAFYEAVAKAGREKE